MRLTIIQKLRKSTIVRLLLVGAAGMFAIVACGGESTPDADPSVAESLPVVKVVTTANFVADWVANVAGERAEVFSLLPLGSDPHSFQPGARDVTKIADADLVLTIGLGLEAGWLTELVHNANTDESKVLALGDFIDPIEYEDIGGHDEDGDGHDEDEGQDEEEEDHDEDEGEDHGPLDPHFWFDPIRVKTVVNEISTRLSLADPAGDEIYTANAASYNYQLDELHRWTQEQVGLIPVQGRLLVTSHDSLTYFAKLYGFRVVGAVIPSSLSIDVEPTAEDMGDLVHEIEENGVPAIFGETTVSERLAQAIAEETGAKLIRLYSGSLGPDGSGAETYIGMQRLNVERIVEALK